MRRRSGKDSVGTEVIKAGAAVIAAAARNARLDSDAVADLDILHFAAHLDDDTGALVTKDDRALEDEVANATALPVVDVATADAGLLNVHAYIVFVSEGGNRAVFEGDVLDGLEDECSVLPVSNVF